MSRVEPDRSGAAEVDFSAFETFPTAVLSDALDELGITGVLPRVHAQRPDQTTIAGPAMTASFARIADDERAYRFGGGVGRPLEQVLQTMRSGQVVVMDLDGTSSASAWGGLASRIARSRGVKGTVIYGTCRDLGEIRSLGYPVWATGTCPRRSRNEFTFGSIEEVIQIGDVSVRPGDVIVADDTGAVCIPLERAQDVYSLATSIAKTEDGLLAQIETDEIVDWDQV